VKVSLDPGSFSFVHLPLHRLVSEPKFRLDSNRGSVPALPKKCVSKFYARWQATTRASLKFLGQFGSIFPAVHRRALVAHRSARFVHRLSTVQRSHHVRERVDHDAGEATDDGAIDPDELEVAANVELDPVGRLLAVPPVHGR
jgi:hypothetical protein